MVLSNKYNSIRLRLGSFAFYSMIHYSSITGVLQEYYRSITGVLQEYYSRQNISE